MVVAMLFAALVAAQPAPTDFTGVPPCADAFSPIDRPCSLPARFNPASVTRLLRGRSFFWWLRGDTLTMIARPTAAPWVALCCSVQTGLIPISGTDLAGVTVRVPHLNEALLEITAKPGADSTDFVRGRSAPSLPALTSPLRGTLESHDFMSSALGERRKVWFYRPPDVPRTARLPAVYMADGWARSFAPTVEVLIATKRIQPVVLIGLEAAKPTRSGCFSLDCDRRGREYERELERSDGPFQAHERFLLEEVLPYASAHYAVAENRRDRAVAGYSQGGVWAAQVAQLRPDLFGAAIVFSGTGAVVLDVKTLSDSRLVVGAGQFEPQRLMAMHRFATLARAAHADVYEETLWAGHSQIAFDAMLARALEWLFPINS